MQATTAVDSKPHRPVKAKLAALTALLSLAATAQALTAAPAAAMDDNGTGSCVLLFIPGMGSAYYDENGNVCEPPSGGSDEEDQTKNWPMIGNEDIEVKPKPEPRPNPRADGCGFGCMKKDTRRPQGREGLLGFPDKPRGSSARKTATPQRSKKTLPTKEECLESRAAQAEEDKKVIERLELLWKTRLGPLSAKDESLAFRIQDLDVNAQQLSAQIEAAQKRSGVDDDEKGIADLEARLANLERQITSLEKKQADVQGEIAVADAIGEAIVKTVQPAGIWATDDCLKLLEDDDKPAKAKR